MRPNRACPPPSRSSPPAWSDCVCSAGVGRRPPQADWLGASRAHPLSQIERGRHSKLCQEFPDMLANVNAVRLSLLHTYLSAPSPKTLGVFLCVPMATSQFLQKFCETISSSFSNERGRLVGGL